MTTLQRRCIALVAELEDTQPRMTFWTVENTLLRRLILEIKDVHTLEVLHKTLSLELQNTIREKDFLRERVIHAITTPGSLGEFYHLYMGDFNSPIADEVHHLKCKYKTQEEELYMPLNGEEYCEHEPPMGRTAKAHNAILKLNKKKRW